MASFSAELRVGGHVFPLLRFAYEVYQSTDRRGRVVTKVRFGLVQVLLNVPRIDFLKAWAADPHKRLAVDLVSLDATSAQALETLHMNGAYCVFYREEFNRGDIHTGSYVLQVNLSDPDGFTITAGGPGTYTPATAREHGTPPVADSQAKVLASADDDGIDLMRFSRDATPLAQKPQSLSTGYLGSSRMKRATLAALSLELQTMGAQLIIDKKGVLPSFARAGFDPHSGKMYLRKGATHFEAFHETQHVKQWAELGADEYSKQPRYEREKYVFDKIITHKALFSDAEIQAATAYINSLS